MKITNADDYDDRNPLEPDEPIAYRDYIPRHDRRPRAQREARETAVAEINVSVIDRKWVEEVKPILKKISSVISRFELSQEEARKPGKQEGFFPDDCWRDESMSNLRSDMRALFQSRAWATLKEPSKGS